MIHQDRNLSEPYGERGISLAKRKRFVSLRIKLVITLALAIIVASLVFVVSREVGDFLVWRYYLDEETRQEREEDYIRDFQRYVTNNKLLTTDSDRINGWSAGGFVEMIFYKDSTLIYAPEWFERMENEKTDTETIEQLGDETTGETLAENNTGSESADTNETDIAEATESGADTETDIESDTSESDSSETVSSESDSSYSETSQSDTDNSSPPIENDWISGDRGFKQYLSEEERAEYMQRLKSILDGNQKLRPVEFVDGTLLVSVVDYTEEFVYGIVFAISLLAALSVLLLIMVINFTGMATRINRLAHKVKLVGSGNLDLAIKVDGNDEITSLANDVNSMRNAVVDNMIKEKKAWETNAELITALSHDVRTPLTVMLGYLDLLEFQNSDPMEEEYIALCKDNALKLKRLSDDMFSYFTVFGKNELDSQLFTAHKADFIAQMIAEHEILIIENGGCIVFEGELPDVTLKLDTVYFGRVIDNVFSNINKYADLSSPITIRSALNDTTLILEFENKIKENDDRAESNRIGLKTCSRIMGQLGGLFEHSSDNGAFVVRIELPVADE